MSAPDVDPVRLRVVEVAASATHEIRRQVLRGGDPSSEVDFVGDEDPAAVHLGVVLDGASGTLDVESIDPARMVAVSSWYPGRAGPDPTVASERVWQLRGMAVLDAWRGRGIGSTMLLGALDTIVGRGAAAVWARARDTAIDFYLVHGFVVIGEGYRDEVTGLGHHDMWRPLRVGATER